ncbi:hypothetical protein BD324DRAFT_53740 [Kockovaella imperatae]|uniref:RING-type E3 ubiquitin transferase n=1 Tax=Kockovaella imperatae TaxID=4999 RepID=A0A1Y1UTC4_9TREE|nr:hypothetical protein BD324DRAFT_53740 [Kockovaella imperatae]ORX41268.1 hypothetical protein BD324DRAFT_53740 [Kockovaella imperatae]
MSTAPFLIYDSASTFGVPMTSPPPSSSSASSSSSRPPVSFRRSDPEIRPLSHSLPPFTSPHNPSPSTSSSGVMDGSTSISPSRVIKPFPHTADLLGTVSETSRPITRRSSPASDERPTNHTSDAAPERLRRRISQQGLAAPVTRSSPADGFEHLDQLARGTVQILGLLDPPGRPAQSHRRSFTTMSSMSTEGEDVEPVSAPTLISPRQVSSNRRIPSAPGSAVSVPPQSGLERRPNLSRPHGLPHASMGPSDDPVPPSTVPPPRRSRHWQDDVGVLEFSPERRQQESNVSSQPPAMTRSTSIGTAFRHRMLRERMARLDALRTLPGDVPGHPGPLPYNLLFGAPSLMNPAPSPDPTSDTAESSAHDIGRWNQNVQEALARRVANRPRSPTSDRRDASSPYSRRAYEQPGGSSDPHWGEMRNDSAHWGEMRNLPTLPIDTFTTGLHDIYHPRGPAIPFPATAEDVYRRRMRLPRAFERPEQRSEVQTPPDGWVPLNPHSNWRDFYHGILGWQGPDTEAVGLSSSASRSAEFDHAWNIASRPAFDLLSTHGPRLGSASGTTTDATAFSDTRGSNSWLTGAPLRHMGSQRWASDSEDDRAHAIHAHGLMGSLFSPLSIRGVQFKPEMTDDEKMHLARAVTRGVGRWPMDIRRKTAEDVVEKIQYGNIGSRPGLEKDEYCSICHDEYESQTLIGITPCHHMYHHKCLDTWLHTPNTSSCPMCRRDLAALNLLRKMIPKTISDSRDDETIKKAQSEEGLRIWMAL